MKTLLTFAVLVWITVPLVAQKNKSEQNKELIRQETEAIKSVIVKETKSFFETDKASWKECWVHAPHAYWSFADSSDVNFYKGWDNIEKGFAEYFKQSKPAQVKIENSWDNVKIYGNGAFVSFRQRIWGDGIERDEQSEIRILEKDNLGNWKIVHVGVIRKPKEQLLD